MVSDEIQYGPHKLDRAEYPNSGISSRTIKDEELPRFGRQLDVIGPGAGFDNM